MSERQLQPRTMLAAILEELHQPLCLDEVELPDELAYGQVLVRVCYTGICGSQLGEIEGVKGEDRFLPHLLGHEASGIVSECGPGVTTVAPGDHVVLHWMKGAGIEARPPVYSRGGRPVNAGWVTTFNEYAIVSENRVTAVPKDLDLTVAPFFGCAITTGLGVIVNNARVQIGESVVIFGAGGVGLNVIQGAALTSAYPIVAVDVVDSKLEMASRFGATHTINSRRDEAEQLVREIVGLGGADVVVDATGLPSVIAQAYELTAAQGRTVLVGVPKHGEAIQIDSLPLHFGKLLTGSHGGETQPARDIPRFVRLYQAGKLRVDELISNRVTLKDINAGIDAVRSGAVAGRCLVEVCPR